VELLFPAVSGNHSQLVPIVAQPSSEQEVSLSFTLHLPTAESLWLRAQRGDQLARLHAQTCYQVPLRREEGAEN
jgi:hypothetical protein